MKISVAKRFIYIYYIDYAMLSCVICILRLLIVYEDNYMFVLSSG